MPIISPLKRKEINADIKVGALLIHGLTGIPKEMRPVGKLLEQHGVITSTPMLAGHGATYKEMLAVNYTDWVESCQKALDELAPQVDVVICAGLSMGAILSLIMASRNESVGGIALLSPTLKYDGKMASRWQFLLPFIDFFPIIGTRCYWTESAPYGLKDERLQKMITRQLEAAKKGESDDYGLFRTYGRPIRQLDHLVKLAKQEAASVRAQSIVVHSLEDTLTSENNAIEIYNRLGSKEKRLIFLSGCDHVMTLDLRKEDVAQLVLDLAIDVSFSQLAIDRRKARLAQSASVCT